MASSQKPIEENVSDNIRPRWIVLVPGEDANRNEVYGPFYKQAKAIATANEWNELALTWDDYAVVLRIWPGHYLEDAS